MKRLSFAVALAAVALGFPSMAPPQQGVSDPAQPAGRPYRDKRRGKGLDIRRGKGVRAKPKKRSNRLTISKRVRRRHRRAA